MRLLSAQANSVGLYQVTYCLWKGKLRPKTVNGPRSLAGKQAAHRER